VGGCSSWVVVYLQCVSLAQVFYFPNLASSFPSSSPDTINPTTTTNNNNNNRNNQQDNHITATATSTTPTTNNQQ
jgi:hypothetical protein